MVARGAQGLGAALLSPAALALVTTLFEQDREQRLALGLWGALAGIGGTLGVVAGGLLVNGLGWRWILFVNVPVGVAMIPAALRLVPKDPPRSARSAGDPSLLQGYDLPGAATITAALLLLVYGLVRVSDVGWLAAPSLAVFAGAAALFAAFLFFEGRARAPLIPLGLLRLRLLAASSGVQLLTGATFLAMIFFTSLYFQQVLGYSALETGLLFLPMGFAAILGAVVAQAVMPRFGTRAVVSSGALLLILGLVLLATVGVHESFWPDLLIGTVLVGIGLPFSFVPANITGVTAVSHADVGVAAGLLNSGFQIGSGLGIAVVTTVATTTTMQALTSSHGAGLREALSSGDAHAFAAAVAFPVLGLAVAILVLRSKDGRNVTDRAAEPRAEGSADAMA